MRFLLIFLGFSTLFWIISKNTLMWLIHSWFHNAYYTHGFVILSLCGVLILINSFKIKKLHINIKRMIFWTAAGMVSIGAGYYFRFRYFTALSFILLSVGLADGIIHSSASWYLKRPIMLLVLIIPLPFFYEVSGYLSYVTAKTAAGILKIFFSSTVIHGVAITIPPDVQFTIGLNCSGASSIFALLMIMILWTVVIYQQKWILWSILLLTIPVGFLTNVFRIICIFLIARSFGMDIAIKLWHDFAGYIFYGLSLTVLFVVWRYLHFKFQKNISFRRLIAQ